MSDEHVLPSIVDGISTRAVFAGSIYPVELQEPIAYHGYPLGNYVHAWTDPLSDRGFSETLLASRRYPELVFRGAVMDSIGRARGDAEQSWRAEQMKPVAPAPQGEDASDLATELGFVVTRAVVAGTRQAVQDLADLFPFGRAWYAEAVAGEGRLALRIRDRPELQLPQTEVFIADDRAIALELLTGQRQISETPSDEWWSRSVFTFAGRYSRYGVGNQVILAAANLWLNDVVLPGVEELNRQRVARAIPEAPVLDAAKLMAATIVLSSDAALNQGTAFLMDGVGWVTCAHVVKSDTVAFRSGAEDTRFPVSVKAIDADVDLAVLEIEGLDSSGLARGDSSKLSVPSPVTIVGFPNHTIGDSAMIRPGMVVSTRRHFGFGRYLTNVGIIAGMSGGPVVDSKGLVVGVAATGSKSESSVDRTEFHSFIPIELIDRVLSAV